MIRLTGRAVKTIQECGSIVINDFMLNHANLVERLTWANQIFSQAAIISHLCVTSDKICGNLCLREDFK